MTNKEKFWLNILMVQKLIPIFVIIIGGCTDKVKNQPVPTWIVIWYAISATIFIAFIVKLFVKSIRSDIKRIKELRDEN